MPYNNNDARQVYQPNQYYGQQYRPRPYPPRCRWVRECNWERRCYPGNDFYIQ